MLIYDWNSSIKVVIFYIVMIMENIYSYKIQIFYFKSKIHKNVKISWEMR